MILNEEDIEVLRNIRIHRILNVRDNGRRLTLPCVFHHDNTPSFSLYPDNTYHCFGCGAHGSNAIDFVCGLGYNFKDSIKELKSLIRE